MLCCAVKAREGFCFSRNELLLNYFWYIHTHARISAHIYSMCAHVYAWRFINIIVIAVERFREHGICSNRIRLYWIHCLVHSHILIQYTEHITVNCVNNNILYIVRTPCTLFTHTHTCRCEREHIEPLFELSVCLGLSWLGFLGGDKSSTTNTKHIIIISKKCICS